MKVQRWYKHLPTIKERMVDSWYLIVNHTKRFLDKKPDMSSSNLCVFSESFPCWKVMSWLLEGHQTFAAWMTSYLVFQSLGCSTAGGSVAKETGLGRGCSPCWWEMMQMAMHYIVDFLNTGRNNNTLCQCRYIWYTLMDCNISRSSQIDRLPCFMLMPLNVQQIRHIRKNPSESSEFWILCHKIWRLVGAYRLSTSNQCRHWTWGFSWWQWLQWSSPRLVTPEGIRIDLDLYSTLQKSWKRELTRFKWCKKNFALGTEIEWVVLTMLSKSIQDDSTMSQRSAGSKDWGAVMAYLRAGDQDGALEMLRQMVWVLKTLQVFC